MLAIPLLVPLMTAERAGADPRAAAKTPNRSSAIGPGMTAPNVPARRFQTSGLETPPSAPEQSHPVEREADRRGTSSEVAPYTPERYRSRLAKKDQDFQLWDLDSSELAWLLAHQREVLTQDLHTRPEPTGGLRVLRIGEGSFAARRGLQVGDILLDINGQDLDGPLDVENLLGNPAYSGARGWRVQVLREGTPLTIDYRCAP